MLSWDETEDKTVVVGQEKLGRRETGCMVEHRGLREA